MHALITHCGSRRGALCVSSSGFEHAPDSNGLSIDVFVIFCTLSVVFCHFRIPRSAEKLQRHERVAHHNTAAQELLTLKVPEHAAIISCIEQSATAVADEVASMYTGRIMAYGPARDVLQQPARPYTPGLMHAMVHHGM